MQLLVSWAIVAISTLYACKDSGGFWWIESDSSAINGLGEVVFFLTVAASFLISFDSYINAKARTHFLTDPPLFFTPMVAECWHPLAYFPTRSCHLRHSCWRQGRWRQLRSCAGALESITWAYRTRVAPFGAHWNNAEHDSAERELREALINWRKQLGAGADLNTTTLRRRFPPRVFKHGQRPPPVVSVMQKCWRRFLFYLWWKRDNAHNTVRVRGGTIGAGKVRGLSLCSFHPGTEDDEG